MTEDETTIGQWAEATFGRAPSNKAIALRAMEEFVELLKALDDSDTSFAANIEVADVVIVLAQIPYRNGVTLQSLIDSKMALNRAREWKTDGNGQGQHV